jgi:polyisoprenyl-teichoic acid--peptidoglycan teichoic acid transferase
MGPDLPPPRVGLGLLKRALIAGVLITLLSGTAVASAVFLQANDLIAIVAKEGRVPLSIPELDRNDAGGPQTLMILGSDERFGDKVASGGKARSNSDTIILVRLDPDQKVISVLSLPRDLKVTIPGNDVPTKINAAYSQGGAALTLKTVRETLSTPERRFRINHVITIGFEAFQRAINYVGCVYYDVDQRYFNDNAQGQNFAAIDIKPGYQRICGGDALDYVRFRHTDNDLVRAARQQDFLRQIKNQEGVAKLRDPTNIKTLAKVFARYFDYDAGLRKKKQLFGLAKLAIFSASKPVQNVPFAIDGEEANGAYLLVGRTTIQKTVDRFLHPGAAPAARKRRTAAPSRSPSRRKRSAPSSLENVPKLVSGTREGEDQAVLAASKVGGLPFYYPALKRDTAALDGGLSSEPSTRIYSVRDEKGQLRRAYRMTYAFNLGGFKEYYGVQGMARWAPPILDDPDATRTVKGRRLQLYYDGGRLRLVAWKTDRGVYWVSNTLLRRLTNRQMLAIAASMRRLGAK